MKAIVASLQVAEDDLSIAIGRRGFNAKLTSRFLGWKLDIGKEERLSALTKRLLKQSKGLTPLVD